MGGYEERIRGEPFRGKFRKSFEKPVAFEPGKPDRIIYRLPDVAHTWREGHRVERIPVDRGDFDRFSSGDAIEVKVGEGLMDIPWVAGVSRP